MTTAAGRAEAVIAPASSHSPEIESATAATAAALQSLQRRWPSSVELGLTTKASIYHGYPYLFLGAFPGLPAARVEPLSLAASLIFDSLFIADDVMDEDNTKHDLTVDVLRIQAMQLEGYQILHGLFPPQARFWDRYRDYMTLYANACVDERLLALPGGDWETLTPAVAMRIAKGKCSLAKLAVAGLAELAGDDGPVEPLTRALDRYYIARQMVDDLSDWRQDAERGYPSLLLARVAAAEFGADGRKELARQPERTLRALYFGGHARSTIELALANLAEIDGLIAPLPDMLWRQVLARLRAQCQALLAELDRIVGAGARPDGNRKRFELALPAPESPWQEAAWTALRSLLERWRPRSGRETPAATEPRWHRASPAGDLMARAIMADALCDADEVLDGQLRPLIEGEARFLLHHRLPSGGWGWSAVSPGLPPDADHLGRVLQVLARLGWREAAEKHCAPGLDLLLATGAVDGVPTWLRGAAEPGAPPGGEPDEAVVAHLLETLSRYDRERFGAAIESGAGWLAARQREDGSWRSPGYRGPYLPTAAGVGLLAAVHPASPALGRAAAFLRRGQRGDGGWGDAPNTALALLGLARTQATAGEVADLERARRGRERLLTLAPWSGRLTAAFALQAALAWHGREAAEGRMP